MKSVMSHNFSVVPEAQIRRSTFNRSHAHKTTFDAGYLVPVYVDEALPGDTFKMNASLFARMSTPVAPIMDNARMTVHFFAVPHRLIWDNWEKFCGAQDNPSDSTDYLVPVIQIVADDFTYEGSLVDYFGIPEIPATKTLEVNSLPFRAYNLIWNEWYRDQNLQDSLPVDMDDGPDEEGDYVLQKRNKRHDYFTSCLPWPQKGPGVELPLGTSAPILNDGTAIINDGTAIQFAENTAGTTNPEQLQRGSITPTDAVFGGTGNASAPMFYRDGYGLALDESKLSADLSNATAATINSLREAFQLQKMYERDARGGTRYTEVIQAHFNVTSPDARLQRPEYLGGGNIDVNVNPIAQTSSTDLTTPQGNLAAIGVAGGSGIGFRKSFTEHCVIIGLVSVTCDLTYQQGINRMWNRSTRFDYYWPALAHLGEQEVLNKEIYYDATNDDDDVFGYQERYAEYRYHPSRISGAFRSTSGTSLDYWHYAQEFGSRPTLNSDFIEENPPIDRVVANPDEPNMILDSYFQLICERPMPVYSVPGYIDHM